MLYGFRLRPVHSTSVPPGVRILERVEHPQFRTYGAARLDRRLTPEEAHHFDLVEITTMTNETQASLATLAPLLGAARPEYILATAYAVWPNPATDEWYDLDGEGGLWNVCALYPADTDDDAIRADLLRRLNEKYGKGWPEAGVPPVAWTEEHFDTGGYDPDTGGKAPSVEYLWQRVPVEAARA